MADKNFNPSLFEEFLGAASIAASIVSSPVIRPWYSKWGATRIDVNMPLPGDDLVANPALESTRAITIQAPASTIWPWLVQLGQGRGGFYSYQRLENLIGSDIHNADSIVPEYQDLKVGDQVRISREGPAFEVAAVERDSTLILRGDMPNEEGKPGIWIWAFFLNPVDEQTTRLILRTRLDYESSLGNRLMWRGFVDPISFNMERKMFQGIKARAEASVSS